MSETVDETVEKEEAAADERVDARDDESYQHGAPDPETTQNPA